MFKAKTKGSSIVETFETIVSDGLISKAEVVLKDFVRKEDERLTEIAAINSEIKSTTEELASATEKLTKAEKVSNQEALINTIAGLEAELVVLNGALKGVNLRIDAAATKRKEFIKSFDNDPYAALADASLVREGLKLAS